MNPLSKMNQKYMKNLLKRTGSFIPSDILRKAEDPECPLHDSFEWEDSTAAHEYRLIQARKIIRRYNVLIEEQDEMVVHVPIVSGSGEGEYKPRNVVVQIQSEYERALCEAYSKFAAAEDAVKFLKTAVENEGVDEQLVKIALIQEAFFTAREALKTLH